MAPHRHIMWLALVLVAGMLGPAYGSERPPNASEDPAPDWPAWATVAPSTGQIRHVATNGSDSSGTGSASAPFLTIQHAVDASDPGDEVWVGPGTYPAGVRLREPRVTVRGSYSATKPRILVPNQNESADEIAVEIDPDADGSRIIGMDIEGGSYYGLSCETKWDWADPLDRSGATGLVIAYNRIHHTGRDAVKIKPNCDDVLLAGNEIHSTGQRDDSNAEGIDNVNGDRMTVLDNYLHDIATTGVYFKGGAIDARVERNLIERVGQGASPDSAGAGILVGFDTDTDYFDLAQNPGMYEAIGGRVVNNIIDGTTMTGIGVYAAKDSLIAHNTIRNCCRDHHAGIHFGVSLQSWMPDGLRPASRNVTVWGNLIGVRSTSGTDTGVSIRFLSEAGLGDLSGYLGMPIMDYNVYAGARPPLRFTDARPTTDYDAVGLAGWGSHIGGESHSRDSGFSLDTQWVPSPAVPVDPSGRYSLALDFYRQPRPADPIAGAVHSRPPTTPGTTLTDPTDPSSPPSPEGSPSASKRAQARPLILARWRALGGRKGPLGKRLGKVHSGPLGSYMQRFAHGVILYSPATGARELMGAMAKAYLGSSPAKRKRLGLPISGDLAGGKAFRTRFNHGTMTWRPGRPVVIRFDEAKSAALGSLR